jgi:tetratricopeptide (TPR) repeat protein
VQGRIDLLVKAAEEALAANELGTAANNYRLALEHREDPRLRVIFEDVDARARALRFEKNIVPARAAERDERWGDAAIFLTRAHEAKPDCDVAWRAAKAFRQSGADLERAAMLAEQAVALAPRNAEYRLTLAEILLRTNRARRAQEECAAAARLAPKDARVAALTEAITKAVQSLS